MAYLLTILPTTLKTKLAYDMYYDAILIHSKFLKDRDENFYAKYLQELQTEKIQRGSFITRAGVAPEYVYFIMNGIIMNQETQRYFESG